MPRYMTHTKEACSVLPEHTGRGAKCSVAKGQDGHGEPDSNESAEQAVREIVKRFGRAVETLAR